MKINSRTFETITGIREVTDHLERADARFLRFQVIEQIRSEKLRRRKIVKSVVSAVAVLCSLYAVLVQV